MKIKNMAKGDWGNCKALFTLSVGGVAIDGFKIVQKFDGEYFVGYPSKKNKNDEWKNTVYIEDENQRNELNKLALEYFENA